MAIGHYGTPAILLGVGSVLALILHLSVPYGVFDPEVGDSETVDRGDLDNWPIGLTSPTTTLIGVILAMLGGLAILLCSFMPLEVTPARLVGWTAGALGAVGSLLVLLSSLPWLADGTGGTLLSTPGGAVTGTTGGLLGLIMLATTDAARFWVISPIFLTVLGGLMLWASFRLATNVVKVDGGTRDRARAHTRSATYGVALVALALIVPWSIASIDDGSGDRDPVFIGAHTSLQVAEDTQGRPDEAMQGMSLALHVFVATAWVALAMGLLGALGGVLASTGVPAVVTRLAHFTVFPAALMWVWSAVMYILAWTLFWNLPSESDATGNMPGFAPIVLVVVFLLWGALLWVLGRQALGSIERADRKPSTSFD